LHASYPGAGGNRRFSFPQDAIRIRQGEFYENHKSSPILTAPDGIALVIV
jgi:hypothetical protein